MREAFFVASDAVDGLYGPYSRPEADRVLQIFRMASDETAELEVAEFDMFGEQLSSGLLPFKVDVVVLQGQGAERGGLALLASHAGGYPHRAGGLQRVLCLGEEPERGKGEAGRTAKRAGLKTW